MSRRDLTPLRIVVVGLGATCVLGGIVGGIESTSGPKAPRHEEGTVVQFQQAPGNSGSDTSTTVAAVTGATAATTTTLDPSVASASPNTPAHAAGGTGRHSTKTTTSSPSTQSTGPPVTTNAAPASTTTTTEPPSLAQGLPTWVDLSASCSAPSGVMSAETETVSGDVANYTGSVTVVVPGSSLVAGSDVINQTQTVLALTGTFAATFTQAGSNIDLCSGAGIIDAQSSTGLSQTVPNPNWGHHTCAYNAPATRCDP